MSQVDDQPGYRIVCVLLILVTITLTVLLAPHDAEGNDHCQRENSGAIDGLAISDKCLTQNKKALNCGRLEVVSLTGSESLFYSRCISLKTVISTP